MNMTYYRRVTHIRGFSEALVTGSRHEKRKCHTLFVYTPRAFVSAVFKVSVMPTLCSSLLVCSGLVG